MRTLAMSVGRQVRHAVEYARMLSLRSSREPAAACYSFLVHQALHDVLLNNQQML